MPEETDAVKAEKVGLDQLPDEILVQILIYVDEPSQLAQVSKRLHSLSQSSHTRAQHFLRKHGRGLAIFFAIVRTKLFTEDLFKTLLTSGATLSLAIAQELAIRNFNIAAPRHYGTPYHTTAKWGKNTALRVVLAVLSEAKKLYSDLHLNTREMEEYQRLTDNYRSWNTLRPTTVDIESKSKTLFEEHKFVPLPFGAKDTDDSGYQRTIGLGIVKWPELALWLDKQQIHLTKVQGEDILGRLMLEFEVQGERTVLDDRLEQMHKSGHPSLRIEESFATRVLMSLRYCKVDGESGSVHGSRRVETVKNAYKALLQMEARGLLDFDLADLVERAVLTVAQRESGTEAARIYHFIVHETDDSSGSTRLARWYAYFLLRQMHSARFFKGCALKSESAPDWTKANSDRTEDDVLSVLLLPAIVDDVSVLAYAKTHGLVADWPQFLARVARCLLLDPFKGKMLKAISKWCKTTGLSHFPTVLARAVEGHAIPSDPQMALPPEMWELCKYGTERRFYRSWELPRIMTVLSSNQSFNPAEATLEGFFLPTEDYTSFEQKSATSELPERFQLTAVRKTMTLNDLYHTYSQRSHDYSYRTRQKDPEFRAPFMDKLDSNGLTIVKLCGASSAAAAVVMDHAVMSWSCHQSSSATELLGLLVKAGCKFTLRHLYFLDRLGRKFPEDLEKTLSTLGATPLAGLEEDEALLKSIATKHMQEAHLGNVEQDVAKILAESPEKTIYLTFDHDDDGSVTCTYKATIKVEAHAVRVQDGRRIFWQPPHTAESESRPEGGSDSSRSTTVLEGASDIINGRLSMKDLTPLPKRSGGDFFFSESIRSAHLE